MMLITEQQAKLTMCPETFAIPGVRNVDGSGHAAGPWPCLGTGCMAFRWFDSQGRAARRGYCGKAGLPVFP